MRIVDKLISTLKQKLKNDDAAEYIELKGTKLQQDLYKLKQFFKSHDSIIVIGYGTATKK